MTKAASDELTAQLEARKLKGTEELKVTKKDIEAEKKRKKELHEERKK